MRKATFYEIKDDLLQCKKTPFANSLIIRLLYAVA